MGTVDSPDRDPSSSFCAIGLAGRVALCSLPLALAACAFLDPPDTLTTRPLHFPTGELETELVRGVSVKADVELLLGPPSGTGSLLFPGQVEPREAWFYERMAIDSAGGTIDIQQDVLLIFFRDELYDGFLWFSDAPQRPPPAESRS